MKWSQLFSIAGNLLIISGVGILIFTYIPIIFTDVSYRINYDRRVSDVPVNIEDIIIENNSSDIQNIIPYDPINKDFAILIPKIEVNAPVVKNVSTINETEYMNALAKGVAHAIGTPLPGQTGNIFMFAHSSLNFWQLGPYATVFNLLNKLEKNDIIVLYYEGNVYEYAVIDNYVVPGWNTEPFEAEYDYSVLTLITCDPPGTTINRRVVRAKLLNTIVQSDTEKSNE